MRDDDARPYGSRRLRLFVAAAPVEGFALLRELAVIDDGDVRRIVRSNVGKSRLSRRHPAEVAEIQALAASRSSTDRSQLPVWVGPA